MADFPVVNQASLPTHIHALYSFFGVGGESRSYAATATPAAITWVANTAVYIPFQVPWPYPVYRVWWMNGSTITSTNVDCGIYSPGGDLLYSTGSTAASGATSVQYVSVGTPFTLDAGRYYMAWTCSNTTSRGYGVAPTAVQGALLGCLSQTSALPLPASATFATYGAPGVSLCGITRTSSGF